MDLNLTISYDSKGDTVKIMFGDDSKLNCIVIPREFYVPFISILLTTGKQMQDDGIDIGLMMDGGDKE